MYSIAIIRYRLLLDEILAAQDDQREYVRDLMVMWSVVICDPF